MLLVHLAPRLSELGAALVSTFDLRLRRVLLLVLAVLLPALIVGALHLLENRHASSITPKVLS